MLKKLRENFQVEDFLTDESFTNYQLQLNAADQLSWEEWLANHPEKKGIVREAAALLRSLSLTLSPEEFSEEFEKMRSAIGIKPAAALFTVPDQHTNRKKYRSRRTRLFYSISIVFVLAVCGYLLFFFTGDGGKLLAETVNETNGILSLTLSDSTVVTLQPHSRLQYPAQFESNNRNVYLNGEASFHVKRNEQAPFKVYTENLIATVLGTVFNIRKPGDSVLVIELLKGKLNVQVGQNEKPPQKSLMLYPDEKAIYFLHSKLFYKRTTIERASLRFSQADFDEIAAKIKGAFGITVINESNKKPWRFSGEFKNTTAKEAVENICVVKGLSPRMKGDTIYIK